MHKAEKDSLLVFPSDDSEEEIQRVKQCLADAGFSAADQEWLVNVFKSDDCFGNPTGPSVFRDEYDDFDVDLKSSLNTLEEWAQGEKDSQTRLMLLFSSMLGFGPRRQLWALAQ